MNYNTFNNEHRSPEQDKEAGLRPPQRVKYLLLSLSMQIRPPEIDKLRGALIRMTQGDSYYHNHQDKGFSYRYPLVQYKRIGGHGAVLVIGEAIETVGKLLNATSPTLQIGETTVPYEIQRVTPGNAIVQVWNHRFAYHLRRWLPLNKANYEEYQQMTSMAEKIRFLENIMVGNVLSFCKGVGVELSDRVECVITQLSEPRITHYKNTALMEFDAEMECNVSIPDYFGIGKGVSHGHGTCVKKREKRENI